MVTERPATMRDVTWLAARMRLVDRREFLASVDMPPTATAAACLDGSEMAWTWWRSGDPVAAGGISKPAPMQPHVRAVWAFGSDDFRYAARKVADKFTVLIPAMEPLGCRRVEARPMSENAPACRWLERWCNATLEAEMGEFGLRGESFRLYSWIAPSWGLPPSDG